jgi:membrane associated rhomboid family serine protease
MARTALTRGTRALKTQATVLGGTLGAFWATFGVNAVLGGSLIGLGIIPRTLVGLRGVLFAPFLHGSVDHLIANSVPFLVLGWLIMVRDARQFLPVTVASALGAGLVAWLFGAPGSVHIGASGVIFGYLGFLMLRGWFSRRIGSIALSLAVTVLWGGLVWGVLPNAPGVSWQAHLGGFVGGILAARRLRSR